MALSGTITGSYHSNGNYRTKLVWSATQDIANNRSTVTAKVYLDADWSLSYSARKYGKTTVNGSSKSWSSDDNHSGTGEWLIASHVFTVDHNSDGTKSLSLSAYFDLKISTSNGYVGRLSVNGDATLNTIPRKSTISSLSNFIIEEHPSISFDVAYAGFKHDIVVMHGNTDIQRWMGLSSLPTTLAFSNTADNNMYRYLENDTDGVIRVYLNTRNNAGDLIGQDYKDIRIFVDESIKPFITNVIVSEATAGLSDKFGEYIQNKSQLQVSFTAEGSKYSSIKRYKITTNGTSYSSNSATTGILKTSGVNRIIFEAWDSRGRRIVTHRDISVTTYDNPKLYSFGASRATSTGELDDNGLFARVDFDSYISPINNKNSQGYYIRYKLSGSSGWTDVPLAITGYDYEGYEVIGPLGADFAYDIEIVVTDYFSSAIGKTGIRSTFTLINFHPSRQALAFGRAYDDMISGRFQIFGRTSFIAEGPILRLFSEDESGHGYIGFYKRGGGRVGYMGVPNTSTKNIHISNENGGDIRLLTTEKVRVNDDEIAYSGTNDNGWWIRLYDGTQFCYIKKIFRGVGLNTSVGSLYRTGSLNWYFPAEFVNDDEVTVSGTARGSYIMGYIANIALSKSQAVIRVVNPLSIDSVDVEVSLMAEGRWKV